MTRPSLKQAETETGQQTASWVPLPDDASAFAGLTAPADDVRRRLQRLQRRLAAFYYKQGRNWGWVVFLGGTGTGKSTVFNALCGAALSEAGVERPKTCGPVAYAHRSLAIEEDFPFSSLQLRRVPLEDKPVEGFPGHSGELLIVEHDEAALSHLVLVDTPDIDSVALQNRQAAEGLYLLADLVVFVASQEKYADEILYRFLESVHREGKPYFFLLNKADAMFTPDDVRDAFSDQGLSMDPGQIRILPQAPSHPFQWLQNSPRFADFVEALLQKAPREGISRFLQETKRKEREHLQKEIGHILDILRRERAAAKDWLRQLDELFQATCDDLFMQQEKHFSQESRQYLQKEIRKLFSRYDVLAGPRRFIGQIVRTPFRLLGFGAGAEDESREKNLHKAKQKIDIAPVEISLEKFNRAVLEKLSPSDTTSPLFQELHRADTALGEDELRDLIYEEQKQLALWLEKTFEQLAEEIPRSKKWGIYSTSILWGALILSFEAAIGGGISALEATLDSALAPFVTKGAVELFAYKEISRIGRELARRYQKGLISVLRRQRDRYEDCLRSLLPQDGLLDRLESLRRSSLLLT